MRAMEIKLKALTPLWTGGVDQGPDRLRGAGLIGSLRWWYEVLVRGLGGHACDPTVPQVRCPDKNVKKPSNPGHHCVACELFGCTGWARKFRLMVLDKNKQVSQDQIKAGDTFFLRFIELRPISKEEWCLLDATLRLIADYGAMGGKTVFKPSEETDRQNRLHHRDFGLITIENRSETLSHCTLERVKDYVMENRWRTIDHGNFAWASLQNFWYVKGRYLARHNANTSSFNFVIGIPEPKNQSSQGDSWLAGKRPNRQQGIEPESKKVFSFKLPPRTFGFVLKKEYLDEIRKKLEDLRDGTDQRAKDPQWQNFNPGNEFLTADQILNRLFSQEERE